MVEYTIDHRPSYSILKLRLKAGESVHFEPGAYVLHRGPVSIKTSTGGGLLGGLKRAVLGGESIFINTMTAEGDSEIWLAPSVTGDIAAVELNGGGIMIQDGSYMAHIGDIKISTAWRGLRGFLAEGELVWLKAEGFGTVFINSYGALDMIELGPGERATIDNMHFVALDSTISWEIRKLGGLKTFIFGGEGIVLELQGPGRVWVQTRNLPVFARVLSRFIQTGQ